jgi:FkbM family methyltransferase
MAGSAPKSTVRSRLSSKLLRKLHARRRWQEPCAFLRPFVPKRTLAFDVGANIGDFTALLLQLGAKPVAIEPTPALHPAFRRRFPKVPLEPVAVSDRTGTGTLLVGALDTDNTLSTHYGDILERKRGVNLTGIDVPLVTVDQLAEKYGEPGFVKIDVEGYEPAVLRGMTFDPPALSFEFHSSLADELRECVELLDRRGYTFRPVFRTAWEWAADWQGPDELVALIGERGATDALLWGDIYCARR